MTIFVSIASYRDPQLIPTVEDCVAKARHPEGLRFGICQQRGDDEPTLPFAGDSRFRILEVPWRESRGACWARSAIMGLYSGEDYFLQLDSHHRFARDWDATLLDQLRRTGSPKPILTTYAASFHPDNPHSFGVQPTQMNFDRFTSEGIILFRPGTIDQRKTKGDPVKSRFLSAHFLFAPGTFVRDVPYDPALYFIGEEITMAVRAFTCGYDLFHPGQVIVCHEYTRDYRPHKHWTDHSHENHVEKAWHEFDRASLDRVQGFLRDPWIGEYGLGRERTFAEYEAYAGVSFRYRKAQDYTHLGLEPPNPAAASDWASRTITYDIEIALERGTLPPDVDDYDFWYVGFHDALGVEIFRADAGADELAQVLSAPAGRPLAIRRRFDSERQPVSWTVWPHSRSRDWLTRIEGRHAPATNVTPQTSRTSAEDTAHDDAHLGHVVVDGLTLMQNRHAIAAFAKLWRRLSEAGNRLAQIVELGTGPGGLSVILKRHCDAVGARFMTYDRENGAAAHELFTAAHVDLRVKDFSEPFVVAEIARELQQPGLTILLCDGSNPGHELSTFADYLKLGDLVLAHDYATSREVFRRDIAGRLWSWCEVTDADIASATERNGLEEVLPDAFHRAVWTCREKRAPLVTPAPDLQCANGTLALYVLTFNAPDQLQRWIASVEAAEPLLLRRSRKFLLNNSTDRTTFPAYDDLARQHGFLQIRQNNLGISGGRLWCARHFEEQTDDDLMVFFEDDMLLHESAGVCRNGLPRRVPGFIERAIEILQHERSVDFLKLSFTEVCGDHRQNWAWYNVAPNQRDALFPQGRETRIDAIRSHAGLSYAIGEFHYSNWPLLITRRGNRTLFLSESFPVHEHHLMVRAFSLARSRRLSSAVLLASPINHNRQTHYAAAERKEA